MCVQNKTKKLLEQKRKALNELETKRQQRDEELKREIVEAKNAIIERSQRLKFEEMDAVKTFNRAIQHCEVIIIINYTSLQELPKVVLFSCTYR